MSPVRFRKTPSPRRRPARWGLAVLAAATLAAAGCRTTAPTDAADEPFALIILPDTHYVDGDMPIFAKQVDWINDAARRVNAKALLHTGDITLDGAAEHWSVAAATLARLDPALPYIVAVGNHDYQRPYPLRQSLAARILPQGLATANWNGGATRDDDPLNVYRLLDVGSLRFLVLSLEFSPRDEVLAWADGVLAAHRDRRVILLTHAFLDADDRPVKPDSGYGATKLGFVGNDGEAVWEKFARKHANLSFVISGHILQDGVGRRSLRGDHGNIVHQMALNFWDGISVGQRAWVRVLRFRPADNRVNVYTYNIHEGRFENDSAYEFSLYYPMSGDEVLQPGAEIPRTAGARTSYVQASAEMRSVMKLLRRGTGKPYME